MSLDVKSKKEIMDLLILSLEGAASEEDFQKLKDILDASDLARDYYCRAVTVAQSLRKRDWNAYSSDGSSKSQVLSVEIRKALIERENAADSVAPDRELTDLSVDSLIKAGTNVRDYKKKAAIGFIASIAAVFIFGLLVLNFTFSPPVETATIAGSVNPQWAGMAIQDGSRVTIRSGEMVLEKGFTKLQFDNGVRVILEGPSKFELLAEDRIRIDYGKVYSRVPSSAIGFTVVTPSCMVIDLGTEFGVKVNDNGDTELHVNQGSTMLAAGNEDGKLAKEVTAGSACRVINGTTAAVEINCDSSMFVRNIDVDNELLWSGQLDLDLADVICGGDGLGSGKGQYGINPVTGERSFEAKYRSGQGQYVTLSSDKSLFLDGVFVPRDSFQIVTSQGHSFKECPRTNNMYYSEIISAKAMRRQTDDDYSALGCESIQYGSVKDPSIIIHPNSGITFDLDEIRKTYTDVDIESFTAGVGIASVMSNDNHYRSVVPDQLDIVFWLLADGEVIYSNKLDRPGIAVKVDLDIPETAKFLTLVITDNNNQNSDEILNNLYKKPTWCVIACPQLNFIVI